MRRSDRRRPDDAADAATRVTGTLRAWTSTSSAAPRPSPAPSTCSTPAGPASSSTAGCSRAARTRRCATAIPLAFDPADDRRDPPDPRPSRPLRADPARSSTRATAAGSSRRRGTCELAELVLLDSGKLQEEFAKREARWEKRHPDLVAADDAKEQRAYQEALDLAAGKIPRRRSHEHVDDAPPPLTPAPPSGPRRREAGRPGRRRDRSRRPPSRRRFPRRSRAGRRWPADRRPRGGAPRPAAEVEIDLDEPLYTADDAERGDRCSSTRSATTRSARSRRASTRRSSTPATSWARRSSGSGSRRAGRPAAGPTARRRSSSRATSAGRTRRSSATRRS